MWPWEIRRYRDLSKTTIISIWCSEMAVLEGRCKSHPQHTPPQSLPTTTLTAITTSQHSEGKECLLTLSLFLLSTGTIAHPTYLTTMFLQRLSAAPSTSASDKCSSMESFIHLSMDKLAFCHSHWAQALSVSLGFPARPAVLSWSKEGQCLASQCKRLDAPLAGFLRWEGMWRHLLHEVLLFSPTVRMILVSGRQWMVTGVCSLW